MQGTYLHIKGLLNAAELESISTLQGTAIYDDGKITATESAQEVKNNLQMNMQCRAYIEIQQIMMAAMNRNHLFRTAVLPKNIYPFLISRYSSGMSYGWHVDSPLMGSMMRTDIAMTIFLNDPAEYEGGELELQSPSGSLQYKLNQGDAICYPCTKIHQVRKVISGERSVAVTWIESLVKEEEKRAILFDLQLVMENLAVSGQTEDLNKLQQNYSNLVRMWAG